MAGLAAKCYMCIFFEGLFCLVGRDMVAFVVEFLFHLETQVLTRTLGPCFQ